jgi:hypothetical protein
LIGYRLHRGKSKQNVVLNQSKLLTDHVYLLFSSLEQVYATNNSAHSERVSTRDVTRRRRRTALASPPPGDGEARRFMAIAYQ